MALLHIKTPQLDIIAAEVKSGKVYITNSYTFNSVEEAAEKYNVKPNAIKVQSSPTSPAIRILPLSDAGPNPNVTANRMIKIYLLEPNDISSLSESSESTLSEFELTSESSESILSSITSLSTLSDDSLSSISSISDQSSNSTSDSTPSSQSLLSESTSDSTPNSNSTPSSQSLLSESSISSNSSQSDLSSGSTESSTPSSQSLSSNTSESTESSTPSSQSLSSDTSNTSDTSEVSVPSSSSSAVDPNVDIWNTGGIVGAGFSALSLRYINGEFVTSGDASSNGDPIAYTSSDGISWSPTGLLRGTYDLISANAIAFGNGTYVAVSGTLATYPLFYNAYSTDGMSTWTSYEGPNFDKYIYFGGTSNLFVASGNDYSDSDNYIYTSSNGFTWVKQGSTQHYKLLGYENDTFIVQNTNDNLIYTSTDGLSWTAQTGAISTNMKDIAYNDTAYAFMDLAYTTQVEVYSSDGANWSVINHGLGNIGIRYQGIENGDGLLVAVGGSYGGGTQGIAYSTDGLSWTLVTHPWIGSPSNIAFANHRFIVIQGDDTYYSDTGVVDPPPSSSSSSTPSSQSSNSSDTSATSSSSSSNVPLNVPSFTAASATYDGGGNISAHWTAESTNGTDSEIYFLLTSNGDPEPTPAQMIGGGGYAGTVHDSGDAVAPHAVPTTYPNLDAPSPGDYDVWMMLRSSGDYLNEVGAPTGPFLIEI